MASDAAVKKCYFSTCDVFLCFFVVFFCCFFFRLVYTWGMTESERLALLWPNRAMASEYHTLLSSLSKSLWFWSSLGTWLFKLKPNLKSYLCYASLQIFCELLEWCWWQKARGNWNLPSCQNRTNRHNMNHSRTVYTRMERINQFNAFCV